MLKAKIHLILGVSIKREPDKDNYEMNNTRSLFYNYIGIKIFISVKIKLLYKDTMFVV